MATATVVPQRSSKLLRFSFICNRATSGRCRSKVRPCSPDLGQGRGANWSIGQLRSQGHLCHRPQVAGSRRIASSFVETFGLGFLLLLEHDGRQHSVSGMARLDVEDFDVVDHVLAGFMAGVTGARENLVTPSRYASYHQGRPASIGGRPKPSLNELTT